MIDKNKMDEITEWLKYNIFRNDYIMLSDNRYLDYIYVDGDYKVSNSTCIDLVDIIASLHNLLYEYVTGERYDYMFHWANKVGSWCEDNIFDNMEELSNGRKD